MKIFSASGDGPAGAAGAGPGGGPVPEPGARADLGLGAAQVPGQRGPGRRGGRARAAQLHHAGARRLGEPQPVPAAALALPLLGRRGGGHAQPQPEGPLHWVCARKSLNIKLTFVETIFQFTKANENNESEFDGEAAGAARHPVRGHPRGALRDQGTTAPTHSEVNTWAFCFLIVCL